MSNQIKNQKKLVDKIIKIYSLEIASRIAVYVPYCDFFRIFEDTEKSVRQKLSNKTTVNKDKRTEKS